MSLWHRSQACDCMKYFAGMFFPSLVCAELGKNLPEGPSPSPSIVSDGILGFVTRWPFFQAISLTHQEPAAKAASVKAKAAKLAAPAAKPLPNHPRLASHELPTNNTPTEQKRMWR